MEVTAGAFCFVPPEPEEDPPQPETNADTKRHKDTRVIVRGFMTTDYSVAIDFS
jgi:hypothetical protein